MDQSLTIDIYVSSSRPYTARCTLFGHPFEATDKFSRTTAAEKMERLAKQIARAAVARFAEHGHHLPEHATWLRFRRHFEPSPVVS
jgi:hypothetical protein